MSHPIFCTVNSEGQAATIAGRLRDEGIPSDQISVLFPDKKGTKDFAVEQHTKAPEAALAGAGTGGAVGGALGWLAGIGLLAIPGVGPFIAAGPIMAALSGAAAGATLGGLSGALIGMGIPERDAKEYEGRIKRGNILMSVHTEDHVQRRRVEEIFRQAGADSISSGGAAAAA